MKLFLISLITVVLVTSCNQPSHQTDSSKAPIDSLVSVWENAWNKHDSVAVSKLFLPDALVIDDNLITTNTTELADKWIHPNISIVNNLKSNKLQSWSTNDKASYTGKYELDVVVNNAVIAKPKGVFTLNWNKTDNGDWKVSTANIHSFTEPK